MKSSNIPEIKPKRGCGLVRTSTPTTEWQLRAWANEGLTGMQIAEKLGYTSPSNVYKALSVLGIVLNPARG